MNPLTPDMQQQLAQLRDIHLPQAIAWWPPALGWWLLLALLLLTAGAWGIRHYRRRVLRASLAALAQLSPNVDDATRLASDLSQLLKRVGLYCGQPVANLSGQAWAGYLIQGGWSAEQADFIAFASYANPKDCTQPDWPALQRTGRRWITQQFSQKGRRQWRQTVSRTASQ